MAVDFTKDDIVQYGEALQYKLSQYDVVVALKGSNVVVMRGTEGQANQAWEDFDPAFDKGEVPDYVTRVQAEIALHRAGLLNQVHLWLNTSADAEAKIYWERATGFHRNHPFVLAAQVFLNLSDVAVDDLFRLAATVKDSGE